MGADRNINPTKIGGVWSPNRCCCPRRAILNVASQEVHVLIPLLALLSRRHVSRRIGRFQVWSSRKSLSKRFRKPPRTRGIKGIKGLPRLGLSTKHDEHDINAIRGSNMQEIPGERVQDGRFRMVCFRWGLSNK